MGILTTIDCLRRQHLKQWAYIGCHRLNLFYFSSFCSFRWVSECLKACVTNLGCLNYTTVSCLCQSALQLNLIWLLILPSSYYTFPLQISWDHFVLDYDNNFHLFATGNQPALTLTSAFLYVTVQLCMTEQYRTHHQVLGLLSPGKAGMTVSNMPNNQIITSYNLICKFIKRHIHNSACNYEIQTASDTTISMKINFSKSCL